MIKGAATAMNTQRTLDPVTLEVIRNALPAIANEMAADLQRTSYNMMIYEVRDYCTALLEHQGRADLAERRRRLALRRRPRRHHQRRHEALRQGRLQARRRHHHQPPGGRRPAPQQRRHLHALLLQGRAADVRDGARALDRRRRHSDRLRRRRHASPIRGWKGCSSTSSRSTKTGKLDETLYRVHQGQHPLSGILARRHEIADGGLPARRRGGWTSCSTNTAATRSSPRSTQIFDETERKCRNVVAQLPDGVYEAVASIDDDGVLKGEQVPIHVKVTVKGGDMTIDLSGCSGERKAAINSRTLPAPASPTRR